MHISVLAMNCKSESCSLHVIFAAQQVQDKINKLEKEIDEVKKEIEEVKGCLRNGTSHLGMKDDILRM